MSSPEKAQTWHRIACVHSMPHLPAKHRHILDETTSGPFAVGYKDVQPTFCYRVQLGNLRISLFIYRDANGGDCLPCASGATLSCSRRLIFSATAWLIK